MWTQFCILSNVNGVITLLCVIVTAKNVDEAGQAHRPNTNQCIVSLDMALWKVSCTVMMTSVTCLVKVGYVLHTTKYFVNPYKDKNVLTGTN